MYSIEELEKIAYEREEWAKNARERDLHGSAREWELTASIARELITFKRAETPSPSGEQEHVP